MKKHLLLLTIPALLAAGCSKSPIGTNAQSPGPILSWFGFEAQTENFIQVLDSNQSPIAGARVLIGNAQNDPFPGNYFQTDANGQVQVPAQWNSNASVTVDVPGYVRQTYLNQSPRGLKFVMRKLQVEAKLELKGTAKGLPMVDKDDVIDFGVVIPAMSKQDLLAFDIGKFISPVSDTITVLGQDINIPSNVSVPAQREHYFFNVTIEKPIYRIYFREEGPQRVYAARGKFAFESVVDKMRGGEPFYNLVNDFQLTGGVIRDVNVVKGVPNLDMPMMELSYKDKMPMQAPALGKDQIVLAVTAADMNGLLIPTDVKKITSAQKVNLNVMTGQNSVQVAVLKNQAEFDPALPGADRLSAVIAPATMGFVPQFLPLVANPSFDKLGNIVYAKPAPVAGVNPLATYAILSEVAIKGSGETQTKTVRNVWEVYSEAWADRMTMPKWPTSEIEDANKKRWEVTFIGSQSTVKAEFGPQLLDSATHVTHSSVEF